MQRFFVTLGPLFLGLALFTVGTALLATLLGVRMAGASVSPIPVGIVMTGYFVGLLVGSLVVQRWVQSVGHIRTYTAFTALLAASILAHPFSFDVIFWTLLRFAQGFCMAGLFLCVESWLNARATRETRGQLLSVYMIVYYGAYAAGQFLLNVPDSTGFGHFVMASMSVSLAAVPIALARIEAPEMPREKSLNLIELYRISPTGIGGSLMAGVILGAFYGFAAFYASAIGLGASETAGFIGAAVFGGLVMQWPIGHLSDRYDRRKVIFGVATGIFFSALGIALLGVEPYWTLLVLGAVFGGFSFTLYPLAVANANDHVDPSDVVATGRGLILTYSMGAILGPLGSALLFLWRPEGLFVFIALAAITTAIFVVTRLRTADRVPAAQQGAFTALPSNTPEATKLDPRSAPPS